MISVFLFSEHTFAWWGVFQATERSVADVDGPNQIETDGDADLGT